MGHVSPQYHLVFDDDFTTVDSMKLGRIPMNWAKLVETQCELATTTAYKLLHEWEEQTAKDYPSTSPLKDWPCKTDAAINEKRSEDTQAMAEPEQANKGDTKVNDGEATLPMVPLNNNTDNDGQEKQQPNLRLMLLLIDLSSTGSHTCCSSGRHRDIPLHHSYATTRQRAVYPCNDQRDRGFNESQSLGIRAP